MKTVEAKIKQQYGNLYRVEILCFSVQGSSGCYYSGSSINDKFPFLAVHDGIFHFPVQRDVIISCINVINKRSTVYILNKSRNKKILFLRYQPVTFSNLQEKYHGVQCLLIKSNLYVDV